MARGEDFTNSVRDQTKQFWEAYTFLKAQQEEWNAQDYSNTLVVGAGNSDVTPAELGAVVFATMDAVDGLMDAGHATNVTTILK